MEDTLRGSVSKVVYYITRRLNPCCNGRYSQSIGSVILTCRTWCLNPCSNGRYSQSHQPRFDEKALPVLILVLMEDTLREFGNVLKIILLSVLILVLVEDTLRVTNDYTLQSVCKS